MSGIHRDAVIRCQSGERSKSTQVRSSTMRLPFPIADIPECPPPPSCAHGGRSGSPRSHSNADDVDGSRSRHLSARVWKVLKRPTSEGATHHGS